MLQAGSFASNPRYYQDLYLCNLPSSPFTFIFHHTASLKVMKIFSHPQTRNQSQVVQNDKLSREYVETKIFVGGNGTFFHFLEKKLKKIWEKISKKIFFFTKICFSEVEKAYVQLFVLNFFFV